MIFGWVVKFYLGVKFRDTERKMYMKIVMFVRKGGLFGVRGNRFKGLGDF